MNQFESPIEFLGKLMSSAESDVLVEFVTEDSAHDHQIMKKQPVMRVKKELKRLKVKVGKKK